MTPGRDTKLIGLYKTQEAATKAVRIMSEQGIPESQISLLRPDDRDGPHLAAYAHHRAHSYAWLGALVGSALGALVVGGLAVGELELEGFVQIASGPSVAAIVGAAVFLPLGALVGALVGWRRPVLRADFFDAADRRGGTALGVVAKTEAELDTATHAFRATGALQVRTRRHKRRLSDPILTTGEAEDRSAEKNTLPA